MKTGIGERLSELCEHEATNFEKSLEYLGATAELTADVDDLYQLMPTLVGPETKQHDELLADELIRNNFLMCRVLLSKGTLAALRLYGADSMIHLRRAIESEGSREIPVMLISASTEPEEYLQGLAWKRAREPEGPTSGDNEPHQAKQRLTSCRFRRRSGTTSITLATGFIS